MFAHLLDLLPTDDRAVQRLDFGNGSHRLSARRKKRRFFELSNTFDQHSTSKVSYQHGSGKCGPGQLLPMATVTFAAP